MQGTETTRLHVRFAGRSEDLELAALNMAPTWREAELRSALARHLDCTPSDLRDYVIKQEEQTIIVRPMAIYG